jgi:hypothetical protein
MTNKALLTLIIYNIMPAYAMKAYGGVVVVLHALSNLALGGHEWSALRGQFTQGKEPLVPNEQQPEWAANILLPLPWLKPSFLGCPVHSLDIKPIMLSWLQTSYTLMIHT